MTKEWKVSLNEKRWLILEKQNEFLEEQYDKIKMYDIGSFYIRDSDGEKEKTLSELNVDVSSTFVSKEDWDLLLSLRQNEADKLKEFLKNNFPESLL